MPDIDAPDAPDKHTYYESVLGPLFEDVASKSAYELACTLLRVGGLQMADWDSFHETRSAFADYNWMLAQAHAKSMTSARRVGLLMYCQAIEMNAVHEILGNLLRCRAGSSYSLVPLRGLRATSPRRRRGLSPPPSAKQKFSAIKLLTEETQYPQLATAIDRFFDERVRNAFSHSDYTLTETTFRFRGERVDVGWLDERIAECFAFYGTFLALHDEWLHALGRAQRFHKWPGYEVLELLSTEQEGLYGFNVHFSNGNKSTFMRRRETGTYGSVNILFEQGEVGFQVGQLELLEKVWKIEGIPVENWDALP